MSVGFQKNYGGRASERVWDCSKHPRWGLGGHLVARERLIWACNRASSRAADVGCQAPPPVAMPRSLSFPAIAWRSESKCCTKTRQFFLANGTIEIGCCRIAERDFATGERVSIEKKPSIRLSREPCVVVKVMEAALGLDGDFFLLGDVCGMIVEDQGDLGIDRIRGMTKRNSMNSRLQWRSVTRVWTWPVSRSIPANRLRHTVHLTS